MPRCPSWCPGQSSKSASSQTSQATLSCHTLGGRYDHDQGSVTLQTFLIVTLCFRGPCLLAKDLLGLIFAKDQFGLVIAKDLIGFIIAEDLDVLPVTQAMVELTIIAKDLEVLSAAEDLIQLHIGKMVGLHSNPPRR